MVTGRKSLIRAIGGLFLSSKETGTTTQDAYRKFRWEEDPKMTKGCCRHSFVGSR
jgi:hypothetical protein